MRVIRCGVWMLLGCTIFMYGHGFAYAQMMPSMGQSSSQQDDSNMGFDDDDNGNTLSSSDIQKMNQGSQNSMYNGFSTDSQKDQQDAGNMSQALNQADKEYKNPEIPFGGEAYAGGDISSKTPFPYGAEYVKKMTAEAVQKATQAGKDACKDPIGGALSDPSSMEKSRLAAPMQEDGPVTTKIVGYGNELKWGDTKRCARTGYPSAESTSVIASNSDQVSADGSSVSSAGDTTGEHGQEVDDTSPYAISQHGEDALANNSGALGNTASGGAQIVASAIPTTDPVDLSLNDPAMARRQLVLTSGIVRPTPSFSAFVMHLRPQQVQAVIATMKQIRQTDPNRNFSEDDVRLLSGI